MAGTHSTATDTPAVGFADTPQKPGDLADLLALEWGGLAAAAFVIAHWGVPWITGVFSTLLAGWLTS